VAGLDSCARLHLDRQGRRGSYFWMGLIGALIGAALVIALGLLRGASIATLVIAVVGPGGSFLVGVKLGHILAGYERIVLYELFAAALGGSALLLHVADQPVLPGLELVTLGVGAFLVFGRIGCLRVGCCHGRPHRRGIRYGEAHAGAGFPGYLVGVRLFPVQLVESLVTLVLVAMAALIFGFRHVPGEVLAYYLVLYGGARFALELIRGDDDRPVLLGLSEAQWIAVTSAWLLAWAGDRWGLHLRRFYLIVALALTAGAIALVVLRRVGGSWWRLQQAGAQRQLGEAVTRLRGRAGRKLATDETPGGLRLSFSEEDGVEHYGVSLRDGELGERAVRVIAAQIARLRGTAGDAEVVAGRKPGMWHLRLAGDPAPAAADQAGRNM